MSSNAKNYAIVFLLCTTLGGAALVFHTRQQLADARNAPTLKVTKTEVKTAAAPKPIVSAPAAAAAPAAEEAAAPEAEAGPGGPNRGQRGAQFAAAMAELMKDPEFAAAMKLEQEARIENRYGSLFAQLNLPPDKLASLKTLLAERENANREVWESARKEGLDPRNPEAREQLRKLTTDLQSEVDSNIEAQLGASVVTALDVYNNTSSQRNTVNDLSQKLAISGASLNGSQSQQLTQILAETGTQSGRNTVITDATITRAAAVLTNVQLTQLKALQAQQQAQQLIQDKTRAAREAAGVQGGGFGGRNGGGNGGGGNRRN